MDKFALPINSKSRRQFLMSMALGSSALLIDSKNRRVFSFAIEPAGVAEHLMYCTARIVGRGPGSTSIKTGTGFFFNVPVEGERYVPLLITNNHVIDGTSSLEFLLHASSIKEAKKPDTNTLISSNTSHWIRHPDPKVDLCALPIGQTMNAMDPAPFYRSLDPSLIKSEDELKNLNAVEDILMVGYPNGLWDSKNNFPLIRRGITASHPAVDFDVEGVQTTVVDIAAFPGSSGSPVLIYNNGAFADKKGHTVVGSRVILLGVLFSGPTFQPDGSIVIRNIPTASVPVPLINMTMNLGYIIKASEINSLSRFILQKFKVDPQPDLSK